MLQSPAHTARSRFRNGERCLMPSNVVLISDHRAAFHDPFHVIDRDIDVRRWGAFDGDQVRRMTMKKVLAIVLLTFALLPSAFATSTGPSLPAESTQQEQNKAIARRVLEEILSQGKFEVADEIYAKDFVNHGLHKNYDLQADQAAARWEKTHLPDMKMTVDVMVAEGDLVTVVWTLRGTNSVPIGSLPATGVRIEERGITVWRIVDGKIRDEWTSFDELGIVRQIVSQLKWQLMGLLGVVVILIWVASRFMRRLWLIYSRRATKATSMRKG